MTSRDTGGVTDEIGTAARGSRPQNPHTPWVGVLRLMPFRLCTHRQRPFAIHIILGWQGSPRSVTRGTRPGVGGTLPPPGPFLAAAGPLLLAATRTLPAVFRPLLGPREHGPRARDSVAGSTTHVGRR